MAFFIGLVPLRDVLAELYPAESMARVVAGEAGLREELIDFDGAAVEFWKRILSAAQSNDQVQDVIDVAREHFPKNARLTEAERVFQNTPVPDGVSEFEPKSALSQGIDSVNISIEGDNDGLVGGRDIRDVNQVRTGNITGDGDAVGVAIKSTVSIVGTAAFEEAPTLDNFRRMVAEIRQSMVELAAQAQALAQIDPAAPHTTTGAVHSVNSAAQDLENDHDDIDAGALVQNLSIAAALLEGTLDRAKIVAEKADAAGKAVRPLINR